MALLLNEESYIMKCFQDSLGDPEFCDVKILATDGEVPANKTVLVGGSVNINKNKIRILIVAKKNCLLNSYQNPHHRLNQLCMEIIPSQHRLRKNRIEHTNLK